MKSFFIISRSKKGFTLLEVIIIIVIAGVLAGFLVTFMGTAITKSSIPVKQTRDLGTSTGNSEIIAATYLLYLKGAVTWNQFKTTGAGYGTVVPITSGDLFNAGFETIQVTVTTDDQKLVSYFTE